MSETPTSSSPTTITTSGPTVPPIAPQAIAPGPPADGGKLPEHATAGDVAEPPEITDHEVGEYREQDRYLPVRRRPVFILANAFLSWL